MPLPLPSFPRRDTSGRRSTGLVATEYLWAILGSPGLAAGAAAVCGAPRRAHIASTEAQQVAPRPGPPAAEPTADHAERHHAETSRATPAAQPRSRQWAPLQRGTPPRNHREGTHREQHLDEGEQMFSLKNFFIFPLRSPSWFFIFLFIFGVEKEKRGKVGGGESWVVQFSLPLKRSFFLQVAFCGRGGGAMGVFLDSNILQGGGVGKKRRVGEKVGLRGARTSQARTARRPARTEPGAAEAA